MAGLFEYVWAIIIIIMIVCLSVAIYKGTRYTYQMFQHNIHVDWVELFVSIVTLIIVMIILLIGCIWWFIMLLGGEL